MAVSTEELAKAVKSLKIALEQEHTDIVRDASIQRFEFCIELFWKVLKKIMGSTSVAPKMIIREAAQQSLINDPEKWLNYIDARNRTSHTYNEDVAKDVFDIVQEFLPEAEKLVKKLEEF